MIYEKKGSIAQITINRPKALNAFNSQMLDELTEALALAEQDPEIRCVILTAAGERVFTAGGDIKEEVQLNEETAKAFSRRGKKMILSILNHRVPVICAVRGYALGGGMEMILAADFTIAASDAKIGIPTIKLGGIPGWGSTILLPKRSVHQEQRNSSIPDAACPRRRRRSSVWLNLWSSRMNS